MKLYVALKCTQNLYRMGAGGEGERKASRTTANFGHFVEEERRTTDGRTDWQLIRVPPIHSIKLAPMGTEKGGRTEKVQNSQSAEVAKETDKLHWEGVNGGEAAIIKQPKGVGEEERRKRNREKEAEKEAEVAIFGQCCEKCQWLMCHGTDNGRAKGPTND
ncbi:hypothetical protein niasHT_036849 [Heterodera trifolii]|uniref:Uncharacterized protein n=1 Tax=Heterodera trifolii TaxID=157864 RepID=A0ABD2I1C2_9BILA